MGQDIPPQDQFGTTPAGISQDLVDIAKRIRSGSGWIFAIAALSAVNSIINVFEGDISFVVGLGATQFIDGFGIFFTQEFPELAIIIKIVTAVISLGIAGVLALFGYFARKGHLWAFLLVGIGYTLDALFVLVFEDYIGAIFHALALFYIGSGLFAANGLRKWKNEQS